MIPSQTEFPKFVPDQLLTSGDLNHLFDYLDEQNRITRTNLVGIGIVCGLHLSVNDLKTELTIGRGCGITSEGYLVTVEENKYIRYKKYDVDTARAYDRFYKLNGSGKKVKMDVWELRKTATEDAPDLISNNFLNGKVILLFVELKENQNKNCDPNSCDDKGINVAVSFLPMAVSRADAELLMGSAAAGLGVNTFTSLPEIRMTKWDVPNSNPVTSKDIYNAYLKLLSKQFLDEVEIKLSNIYSRFGDIVAPDFALNPFHNLVTKYKYLYDGTIGVNQVQFLQYQFDLFSDILQAYQEFRKIGAAFLSSCCPDSKLFPRHLLLGEALPAASFGLLPYRHYFIYSPLYAQKNIVAELQMLFKRIAVMLGQFYLPSIQLDDKQNDTFIRITPSLLNDELLSKKSIPYYYHVSAGSHPLLNHWSYQRTLLNDAHRQLSYYGKSYNSSDDFVRVPLNFDLEPYNFLRIEGVIGKAYQHVLRQLKLQIKKYRLPIEVIALRTGAVDPRAILTKKQDCNLKDLELVYDVARREWEAINGQTIEWLDDNRRKATILVDAGAGNKGRLQQFISDLHDANKMMVDDLPEFMMAFNTFILLYEKLEATAEAIRIDLVNLMRPNLKIDLIFAEDLLDHIDEITLSIKKGTFRSLRTEFLKRLEDIYSNLFFSHFAKKHPGLQHKAGTTMGGTFIIVYKGHDRIKQDAGRGNISIGMLPNRVFRNGNFILAGFVLNANGQPIIGATIIVEGTRIGTTTNSRGNFLLQVNQLPAVLIISAAGFDNRSVTFNDNDDNIEISLQPSNTDIFDEIPEGTVIADFYLPYSCCSDCAPIQFTVKDPEPNKPPVAVPGESRIIFLPENSVTLDGSLSSDPDGTVNAYAWKQVSGPADANFSASTDPVIMVSELNIGDYVFTLTVTDNSGATDTKQITITVKEKPNEPPVAVAFAQPAIITIDDGRATVLLDGSNSSDPEHSALIYLWSQDAAQTGATIQNNALANTDVNFSKTGRFNFRLTVTDDKGAASFADVLVIVNEVPNEGPVAVATADPNPARLSLNFEVNVSLHAEQSADPEGNDLVFEWLQPATQANAVIADPLGKITNVHITAAGDYNFTIRVTDDHNNSATDTVTVKVLPADIPQGKQCGPLPVIVDGFGKLQGTIKIEVFNAFKNRFGFYNEVEAYFKILQEIENENADVHFEFFNRLFENQLTPVLIQKWLIKLQEIIIANKEFRVLALRLYRVLIALSTYIVCIQDKDFDQQIVLMVKVFTQMRRHFIQWKDLFSQGLFSNTDLKLIEATGLGIELEIKKVVQNGEENDKAKYVGLLNELLLIIRSIR